MKRLNYKYVLLVVLMCLINSVACEAYITESAQVNFTAPPPNLGPPNFNFTKVVPVNCPINSSCYGVFEKVRVEITINPRGVPVHVSAVAGDPRLRKAVENAVMQYRFWLNPNRQNEGSVKATFNVIVPPPKK